MKGLLLKTLTRISLLLGSWPIRLSAWCIAAGYFLFCPSRRKSSVRLYNVIFPGRWQGYYLYCAWRQFQSFAATYADRIDLEREEGVTTATEGREWIIKAAERGRGGVILTSHVGSYEVAARAFQKLGLRLLLIMGEKEAKQVARDQRRALKAQGVHIQVATEGEDPLFRALEAIKFIREGGFVSLAGDLVWSGQRLLSVKLFDQEVKLPAGPHVLALVSGAPLFTMFTFRIKRGRHQVLIYPSRDVKSPSLAERDQIIQESAQSYVRDLEEVVR